METTQRERCPQPKKEIHHEGHEEAKGTVVTGAGAGVGVGSSSGAAIGKGNVYGNVYGLWIGALEPAVSAVLRNKIYGRDGRLQVLRGEKNLELPSSRDHSSLTAITRSPLSSSFLHAGQSGTHFFAMSPSDLV